MSRTFPNILDQDFNIPLEGAYNHIIKTADDTVSDIESRTLYTGKPPLSTTITLTLPAANTATDGALAYFKFDQVSGGTSFVISSVSTIGGSTSQTISDNGKGFGIIVNGTVYDIIADTRKDIHANLESVLGDTDQLHMSTEAYNAINDITPPTSTYMYYTNSSGVITPTSVVTFDDSNSRMSIAGLENDVALNISSGQIRIQEKFTPPDSSDSTFPVGSQFSDDDYLYRQVAATEIKRIAWTTF